jgi:soluble lytic murein transglycosylase
MRKFRAVNKSTSIALLGIGVGTALAIGLGWYGWRMLDSQPKSQGEMAALVLQTPTERSPRLTTLAQSSPSPQQYQARYVLAVDLLPQQPDQALKWLDGLDQADPVLVGPILVKRAQSYELAGQAERAIATWQAILKQFPDQPEAAQALYALGKSQPRNWDQLIAQFPAHPRAVEVAQARLKKNPNQPALLLLLAHYALYLPEITTILDRLTKDYARQLSPEDWQAIGFAYWEKLAYLKAGQAYARAPSTSLNAYRAARGLQLGEKADAAIPLYQRMVQQFPNTPETPLAWLRLARLSRAPAAALSYLDQSVQASNQVKLPEQAATALLEKLEIYKKQGNTAAAVKIRQAIASSYGQTASAAQLDWQLAQQQFQQGQPDTARQMALAMTERYPNSDLAPRAAFWAGKWASQPQQKQQAFKILWQRYPQSYYAWRAAALSGWPVGDFSSIRSLQPQITLANRQRLSLATGSATLQALYQLGQDRDAWERWQWEFRNRVQPTMAEQQTDGLLRIGVSDYLDGIFMLENLRQRLQDEPANRPQFEQLQQQIAYWYTLYPMPYQQTITKWSQQRQLNPLLVMSLIRQESRFQPKIRSVSGAVGLMQVMPDTANWIAQQLKLNIYVLDQVDDNVKLGTWYLDHTHETYQNNTLMALASYNAGPGNLDDWLKRYSTTDLDAFVESIPFPETQNYVKQVLQNYWNYLRLYNPEVIEHLQRLD